MRGPHVGIATEISMAVRDLGIAVAIGVYQD
jgi:hypothetical protein